MLLLGSVLAGIDRSQIVARFDSSAREVWLYAPKLSDRAQADALRCRQRSSDRDSYAYSLALARARLFEARVPNNPVGFALSDRRTGLEGVGIGVFTNATSPASELNSERARTLHRWFLETLGDPRRSRIVSQTEILARLAAQSRAR